MEEWQKVREYSSGQDKDTLDNCWRKKGRRMSASASITYDENRDSPERDMVNPSTDSYMWPIRDTH